LLLRLFWQPIQKDFEQTRKNIETHSVEAERWANAVNYTEQQRLAQEATRRHKEIIRIFPHVVIESKDQREVRSFTVPRNPKFFGREDVLLDAFKHLQPRRVARSQDDLRSYTLYGLGGVGKSQTATEYLHRYLEHYPAIFWFRAETSAILRQEMAEAANKIGVLPEGQTPDITACITLFLAWLFATCELSF
jgi:hypothetical protein